MASWLHRALRELVFLIAGLAALVLLAAAGLWWWSGSEGSLAWTLRQIARYQPLQSQGVHGSLREGLRIERLHWQQDGLDVEADDVHLEWQPLTLTQRQLRLDQVEAARVRVEDRRPPSPSKPPESIDIPLRIAADQVRIGRLDWSAANDTVTIGDVSGAYSFDGARHRVQLDDLRWAGGSYRGQATLGARQPLPLDARLEGRFEADVPGGSTGVPLQFNATVQGPITDLKAQAFLNAPTAAPGVPRGTASVNATASATVTARITPWTGQPIAQAHADFRQLDLAALWPQRLPHTSLTGALSVQPAATGTWTVAADVTNALAGPWDHARLPVDKLSAQGEWRTSGQALVRSLQARLGAGELQAHGEWRSPAGWAVQGQWRQIDPSALYSAMAALPLNGSAELKGEGSAVDFEVDLKAAAGKAPSRRKPADRVAATVRALELRHGSAHGRWADGRLALPAFDIRTADASLRGALNLRPAARAGSGRVSLDAPGLQVRADGELAAASGRGNARLDIGDAAQAWRWLHRLPIVPASLPDLEVGGRGEAQIEWQGGWRDPALRANVAMPLLEVRGPVPAAEAGNPPSAPWVVRDVLASIDGRLGDAALKLRGRAEQGRRRVGLELAGRGGLSSRSPDAWQATVASLNVSASDPALGTGTWTVTLQRPFDLRGASGSFDAGAGQALLNAPATRSQAPSAPAVLAWDPVRWRTGELRTAGRLTGLPLAWLELAGGPQWAGTAFSGDMVFDAQWDASLGATARLRATLARSRGDVTVMAETVQGTSAAVRAGVRDARLTLTSEGEAVTLALKWDSERGGTADGRIATRLARGGAAGWNWPATAPLDGALRAQLPRIGVWSLLAPPGWRLRGSLAADIAIAGTRAEPRLAGTLGADDLALRSVVDGVELQGGRLRARLDGQRLVIDEFMLHGAGGANGGGTVVATGEGAWTAAGAQARVWAQLTRLRASIRSDRQLTVSGQLAANVSAGGTELIGNLKVDQARVVLPEETAPRLGDDVVVRGAEGPLTKAQARTAEQAQAKGSQRLKMAVDIDLGDDFRVQGHGIDTRLRGTLALSGESVTSPRLNGTIRSEGGEYQAYGQRLNIERGVLRFTGAIDNPSLDILAIRPYLTQRVGVQVTGTPLTPYVQLYSEPDMADADKLSWLVLGRASASGGAEAALLQQAAVSLLASRTGSGKRGVVASLGLDELSFSRSGPEGPAVTLGKRFGRNVYAAYERSLSGAMGTLQVFYDLTRTLKLRAETGERTAVDLIYTWSFN